MCLLAVPVSWAGSLNDSIEVRLAELRALACIDNAANRFDDGVSTSSDVARPVFQTCRATLQDFNKIKFSDIQNQSALDRMWFDIIGSRVLQARVQKREFQARVASLKTNPAEKVSWDGYYLGQTLDRCPQGWSVSSPAWSSTAQLCEREDGELIGLSADRLEFEIRDSQIVRVTAWKPLSQSSDEWGMQAIMRLGSEVGEPKSSRRVKREFEGEQSWKHHGFWWLLLPVAPHFASITLDGSTLEARLEFGRRGSSPSR